MNNTRQENISEHSLTVAQNTTNMVSNGDKPKLSNKVADSNIGIPVLAARLLMASISVLSLVGVASAVSLSRFSERVLAEGRKRLANPTVET